jgi:hypothetical protein
MKKFACLLGALAVVASVNAAPIIAGTDFLNNGLVGPNQTLNLIGNSGSTVQTGVAAAAWTTGPDLTAVGTPGTNSIWATGWEGTPGDYIKLSLDVDSMYQGTIEELRFATRRSGSGPTSASATLTINGSPAWGPHNIDTSGTAYVNEWITGLSIPVNPGDDVVLSFVGSGGGSGGSWRVATYFDGATYYPTGILGTLTMVPEPASVVLLGLGVLGLARRR